MKKILLVLSLVVVLCGCTESSATASKESTFKSRFTFEQFKNSEEGGSGHSFKIMTDQETGCRYLVLTSSHFENGVTPLLGSDGLPTGCRRA